MSVKPKLPSGKGQSNVGQLKNYEREAYAEPFESVDSGVMNMDGTHDDIGEKSGFQANTESYIVKKGMVYGEAAKLNIMPPGMDINDQPYRDIREMPLKLYSGGESFPDDGWHPAPKDLPENYQPKGKAQGYSSK